MKKPILQAILWAILFILFVPIMFLSVFITENEVLQSIIGGGIGTIYAIILFIFFPYKSDLANTSSINENTNNNSFFNNNIGNF